MQGSRLSAPPSRRRESPSWTQGPPAPGREESCVFTPNRHRTSLFKTMSVPLVADGARPAAPSSGCARGAGGRRPGSATALTLQVAGPLGGRALSISLQF